MITFVFSSQRSSSTRRSTGWVATLLLTVSLTCIGWTPASAAPQADAAADTTVVAVFDTTEIDLDEFERAYARTVGSAREARNHSVSRYQDFLEQHVNYRLKLIDARRRGLDENLYAESGITERPSELARRFLVRDMHERRLRQLYERGKKEVKVSRIMVKVGRDAPPSDTLEAYRKIQALRDSLAQGASFNALAADYSDASSAPNDSGRVGWIGAGTVGQNMERHAWNTPVGEVSPIYRDQFGYNMVKVHDTRAGRAPRRISHIFVRPGSGRTQAESKIRALQDSIESGMDFGRLAYQYSDHTQTANRGGDFGWVHFSQMEQQAPGFARGAFRLDSVGAVSPIVQSRYGYHLIKVTDMQDTTSFEAARAQLEERLQKLPRGSNLEAKAARRVLNRVGYSVDSSLVDEALSRLPSEEDAAWEQLKSDGFPADLRDRVVATIGDSTYTLADVEPRIRSVQAQPDLRETVDDRITNFMEERVFAYMVPVLRENRPEFARMYEEYRNGALLYRVSQETVWQPAHQNTAALRDYYEEHRDQYTWPKRYRAITFTSPADTSLQNVVEMLEGGRSIEAVARSVNEQFVRVDTARFSDSLQTPHDRVFSMEPGQHTDVLSHDTQGMVVYFDGIEEPRRKTFEEARMAVAQDYQQILERRWVERLREQYDAQLYPERLRHAYADGELPETAAGDGGPTRTTSRSAQPPRP